MLEPYMFALTPTDEWVIQHFTNTKYSVQLYLYLHMYSQLLYFFTYKPTSAISRDPKS